MTMINCYILVRTGLGPSKYECVPFNDGNLYCRTLDDIDATDAAIKVLPTHCNVEQSFALLEISASRGVKLIWWAKLNGSEGTRRLQFASSVADGAMEALNIFAIKTLLAMVK